MKNISIFIFLFLVSLCKTQVVLGALDGAAVTPTVTALQPYSAVEFNNLFASTAYDTFTGADGIYSVKLPNGTNLWSFGDTFYGNVNADGKRNGTDPGMLRNTFVHQLTDNSTQFLHNQYTGRFYSKMVPDEVIASGYTSTEDNIWYWPGSLFVANGAVYSVGFKYQTTGAGIWGFGFSGKSTLFKYNPNDITESARIPWLQGEQNGVRYGGANLIDGVYLYIYGAGSGGFHVARTLVASLEDNNWEFYNGSGWSADPASTQPFLSVATTSEQFSVFKVGNKFHLVTQPNNFGNQVFSYTSDLAYTAYEGSQRLFYTVPTVPGGRFTYNALMHPEFTQNGYILLSYCTNSNNFSDIVNDASIYRPRFVWIPLSNL